MTLNGRGKIIVLRSHQKSFNGDRHILSAAKCRPMILVSKNIRYKRIFAGVPRGGGGKNNKCYACVQTLNKNVFSSSCR